MARHERRKGPPLLLKTVTAEMLLRVIRRYCLRCSGSKKQVKVCNITSCPLHPYRNCTALVQIDMSVLLDEKKRRT